ncbi:hypothetical protein BVRB_028630, partial [Beta vulgaris subsp. vulgaris]
MPRIVAFSPATALTRSSQFDNRQAELQSPELKSLQLKWLSSPRTKTNASNIKGAPIELDFDQSDDTIGVFRLIDSQAPPVFDRPDQRWTDDIHELPLESIAVYLSMAELSSVMRTCRRWRSAFSHDSVWRMVYARTSHPQVISRRSHARSWRSLCLSGPRLSIPELLSLQPEHCYFDMTPPLP